MFLNNPVLFISMEIMDAEWRDFICPIKFYPKVKKNYICIFLKGFAYVIFDFAGCGNS